MWVVTGDEWGQCTVGGVEVHALGAGYLQPTYLPAVPAEAHTPSSLTWRQTCRGSWEEGRGLAAGQPLTLEIVSHVAEEVTLVLADLALTSLWWFAQMITVSYGLKEPPSPSCW